jgi:YD repeat-containing protein
MEKAAVVLAVLLMTVSVEPQAQRDVNQKAKSDKEWYGLMGQVETVRYEWATLKRSNDGQDEYLEGSRTHVNTVTFDIEGKKIKVDPPPYRCGMSMYEAFLIREPTYDARGNLIEEVTYDPQGSLKSRKTMKYDDNGNEIELSWFGADGLMGFKWTCSYDDNHREIERARFDENNRLQFREILIRNDRGNVVEKLTYDEQGALSSRETSSFEYDSTGNWIKSTDYECGIETGSSSCRPYRVDYRFITYYAEKN